MEPVTGLRNLFHLKARIKALQICGNIRRNHACRTTNHKQAWNFNGTHYLHIVGVGWRENVESGQAGLKACPGHPLDGIQ